MVASWFHCPAANRLGPGEPRCSGNFQGVPGWVPRPRLCCNGTMSNANHTTSGASWQPPQGGQGAPGWQPPQGRPAGSPGDYERYSTRFFSWIRESGLTRGDERWIGGVCGGLASYLGWSPMLVRALMVGAVLVCGIGAAFYGLAWFLLPDGRDGRILCEELMGARWDWSCVGVLVCLVATIFWPGMWIFGLGVGASALWLIVWSCVNRRNEADANRWRAQGNAAPGYAAGGYAGYAAGAGAGGYASGADGGYATGAAGSAAGAGAAGYAAGAAGGYDFRQETGAPAPGASVFGAAAPGAPAQGPVPAPQGMGDGGGASGSVPGSASGGVPVFGGTTNPGGAANPYGAGTPNGGPDLSVPTAPDGAAAHGPASEPGLTRNDGAAPVPSGPRGEVDSANDAAAAPGAAGTTVAASDAADGGTATVGGADDTVADDVVAAADDVTVDAAAVGAAAVDGAVVDAAAVAAPVAVSGRNADAVDPADGAGDGTTGDDTAGDGANGDAIHADADPAARAARLDDAEPSAAPGTRLDDAESSAVPGARPGDAGPSATPGSRPDGAVRQPFAGPSGPAAPPSRPIP
ncbi:PspC domain-containing protein, partial [Bifidobacterium phasiani]|uniref:PspC domain-containing protein n=1 Tax=Bifidobacterium phasiani TaxID=2834431 RepID=UPI0030845042